MGSCWRRRKSCLILVLIASISILHHRHVLDIVLAKLYYLYWILVYYIGLQTIMLVEHVLWLDLLNKRKQKVQDYYFNKVQYIKT